MIVDEAHIAARDYSTEKVETLPIEEFRSRFGGIPFKGVFRQGQVFTARETHSADDVFGVEGGVVRYVLFSDTAGFADAAVIFDNQGKPVMDLSMHTMRGLGMFYTPHGPRESQSKGVKRIYKDLAINPLESAA